jgi:hypothetical protein
MDTETAPSPQPPKITVRALADPVVDELGFAPTSRYVEVCWLGILGPTATWAYRRLGSLAEVHPEGTSIDLADLALSLGLGQGTGKNSMVARALGRLVSFNVARWEGEVLAVRRRLAPLPERRVARLSASAARAHAHLTGRHSSS